MKSFPIYTQHDTMDCGPTCLRMIAAYYGKKYSLDALRDLSCLSREGVSILGISVAAEKIGMRTLGVQISFKQLCDDMPLPCIVHWNQEHFVVVYKITGKGKDRKVYVADPRGEKMTFTVEEFCKCWCSSREGGQETGVALALEPTPDFYSREDDSKSGKKKSLGFLFSYLKPYKGLIVQLAAGLLVGSLLQLILPFLTQSIVDFGISGRNIHYVYLVLIAQLMLTFGSVSIEFIRGWILLHLGMRVNIALISDYLSKLMRLPISYFDTKMTGDILQRINDHSRIQDFLTNSSLSTLFSVFNIVVFGLVILVYNPWVFLIFFAGSLLYVAWIWLFMKKRAELDHKSFAQQSANQSNVIQLITGMQEIKLNGCEQTKRWEWEHIQANLFKLGVKGLALGQYQESGGILINQAKNFIITAFVASLVIKGEITLGMMLSIQYIIGQLNSPVDQIISFVRQFQDANLSLDRLQEIYRKENEEPIGKDLLCEIPPDAGLELKDMSFSYDPLDEQPTLGDINLVIPPGKQTAIVGMSGSGKTTLVKLLLGFYPPQDGDIELGHSSLSNYNLREWRKECGVVMQDGFIFSDTIARNIAPAGERINKKKLLKAVRVANIQEFIEELPLKYNTKIGQEGHGLSQGQKQRILIARAVYKDPEYIFFDEATNALDANNEQAIMENLREFFQGRTSIVVAHRLSTVRHADQIIVLSQGKIAETGTHDELIAREGIYYRLVKNQLNI